MQHFIAMLLVTRPQVWHGSEQVQGKLYQTTSGLSLQLLNGVNWAVMIAWLGMALEIMTPSRVTLMYIVSKRLWL